MSYKKIEELTQGPNRIHLLFPTPEESQKNPDLAYSDHLPILSKVPLLNHGHLNIISLNILGNVVWSGVHAPGAEETDEQTEERYQRIVQVLIKSIALHQVDVLALQEATSGLIIPILDESLGASWEIITDEFGIVTCINNNNWTVEKTSANHRDRIRSLTLKNKNAPELTIDFHNIWGAFDQLPKKLEDQCKNALTESHSTMAVIMGDTNSRLAPLDNTPRNIVTGAIPLAFNQANGFPQGQQIPDYPDGGFYKDELGIIHQLETHILDFEHGEIFLDPRQESAVNPWPEYRMVMCLDDHYEVNPIVGESTIFEYEKSLQEEFNNEKILVRVAANCFNHKAVAVAFPRVLTDHYSAIHERLGSEPGFQFKALDSDSKFFNCIFAPIDKVSLLQQTISDHIYQKNHPLAAKIKTFFATPSATRDAVIGFAITIAALAVTLGILIATMGIGAIPVLVLGSSLVASLGTLFTGLTLAGIATGIVGFFTGAAVVVGLMKRNLEATVDEAHTIIPKAEPIETVKEKTPEEENRHFSSPISVKAVAQDVAAEDEALKPSSPSLTK